MKSPDGSPQTPNKTPETAPLPSRSMIAAYERLKRIDEALVRYTLKRYEPQLTHIEEAMYADKIATGTRLTKKFTNKHNVNQRADLMREEIAQLLGRALEALIVSEVAEWFTAKDGSLKAEAIKTTAFDDTTGGIDVVVHVKSHDGSVVSFGLDTTIREESIRTKIRRGLDAATAKNVSDQNDTPKVTLIRKPFESDSDITPLLRVPLFVVGTRDTLVDRYLGMNLKYHNLQDSDHTPGDFLELHKDIDKFLVRIKTHILYQIRAQAKLFQLASKEIDSPMSGKYEHIALITDRLYQEALTSYKISFGFTPETQHDVLKAERTGDDKFAPVSDKDAPYTNDYFQRDFFVFFNGLLGVLEPNQRPEL